MIDEFNGVGVYRGGFRIRPYGDNNFDWLNLNYRRVQIPTVRISSNQIIGIVNIESEEDSGLEEKSARDGLIENAGYQILIERLLQVIKVLEDKRYEFRVTTGRGRRLVNIEKALESLFDFNRIAKDVEYRLSKFKVPKKDVKEIVGSIHDVKEEKAKELENIKETIALYQGQASLGRMVGHILHEGRKPVAYLKNRFPKLQQWSAQIFENSNDQKAINRLKDELPDWSKATDSISHLFSTLDPFSIKKGERYKKFKILNIIEHAIQLFAQELDESKIEVVRDISSDIEVYARPTDISYIFSNLVENSIYWLNQIDEGDKEIKISVSSKDDYKIFEFYDNGPGAPEKLLEDGKLFEPGVSLKESGTGLGLALVGEMVKRNNGEAWVSNKDKGISFYIGLPESGEKK